MVALKQTFEKISNLNEEDAAIVVHLVEYLAGKSENKDRKESNPFHKAWEEGSKHPMTEKEADDFVASVRRERNARSN